MVARDLSRNAGTSLCDPLVSNTAWPVAPIRQLLGLSSDCTPMTDFLHTLKTNFINIFHNFTCIYKPQSNVEQITPFSTKWHMTQTAHSLHVNGNSKYLVWKNKCHNTKDFYHQQLMNISFYLQTLEWSKQLYSAASPAVLYCRS